MTTMFLMRWLRGGSNKCGLRDEIRPIFGSIAMSLSLGISPVLGFMNYGLVKLGRRWTFFGGFVHETTATCLTGKEKSMGCVRDLVNCTIMDIDGIDKRMYD